MHTAVPVAERAPMPIAPPAAELPRPMAQVAPAPAPVVALKPVVADVEQALKQSGLQLVETKPGVKAELPVEPTYVPVKRERRPPPTDLSQPMQQVETQHKEG